MKKTRFTWHPEQRSCRAEAAALLKIEEEAKTKPE
jgi:hypothetical protein